LSSSLSLEQRFLDKIEQPADDGACWPWKATLQNSGYGRFWLGGRLVLAHRVAYELWVGPLVPEDNDDESIIWTVDHTCHNSDDTCPGGVECLHRRCCNPAHLELVPKRTNLLRGQTIAATNAAKTHCLNGHAFTPGNTAVYTQHGRKYRSCRQCASERNQARRIKVST
jgi:hypothetical protein